MVPAEPLARLVAVVADVAEVADVAVAALPLMLIPHVPEALVPVVLGAPTVLYETVSAPDPLNVDPLAPPAPPLLNVSELGVFAEIVPDPPSATATPLNVTLLLVSEELAILLSVLLAPLIVLFVSVCAPFSVATEESIVSVRAAEPSNVVPVLSARPVLMVSAFVVLAVMVPDAPSATATPLKVTLLFVSAELPMLLRVFDAPLIVLLVSV